MTSVCVCVCACVCVFVCVCACVCVRVDHARRMSVPAFVHNGDSGLERNFMLWQPALFAAIADAKTPELRMKAVATFVFSTFQGFLVG